MKTEFYLNVGWKFYRKHFFITPTFEGKGRMTAYASGVICVALSNSCSSSEPNKILPYTIYFDTQENMMNFRSKYL